MQRIFLTLATAISLSLASGAAALAADVARPVYKAPPPAPVAPYSWTGFYVGIHGGGAWFDKDWFYPCSATNLLIPGPCDLSQGGHSGSSWLAGGQIGFNYQVGQWVWGIEAQFSATRIKGDNLDIAFPTQERLHSRTDFIGTVAPRLGLAWDRVLLYAKGGVAWAHDDYWLTGVQAHVAGMTFATANETRWGWMVGAGVEYGLAQNWSVKVEYNYLDFGTKRIFFTSTGVVPQPPFDEDIEQRIHVAKVGLNYRFDLGGLVAARY